MSLPKELMDYSAQLGFPGSATMERILEILFESDAEKRIFRAMPGTLEEIASKTGCSISETDALLEHVGGLSGL